MRKPNTFTRVEFLLAVINKLAGKCVAPNEADAYHFQDLFIAHPTTLILAEEEATRDSILYVSESN